MEVDVESDTLASSQRVDLSLESLVLRTVACSESLVGLVTRVGGSTTGELPLVGPVTVDVSANARVSGNSLTVLTPETVGGLGVNETCRDWLEGERMLIGASEAYHQG